MGVFVFVPPIATISKMPDNRFAIPAITLILGLVVGFLVASKIDKGELDRLRVENDGLKTRTNGSTPAESALTDDEIEARLAEAENRKDDFQFQKNLGTALYRYAAMKQDADLLLKIKPVVARAAELGSTDNDVLITAGNLFFDLAYLKRDRNGFRIAREYYAKTLARRPSDSSVLTDLGLTYFLDDPPDYLRAAEKLNTAAEINPRDQRALQFAIQAQVRLGKTADAEKNLTKLRAASPNDPAVNELSAAIETAKTAANRQ